MWEKVTYPSLAKNASLFLGKYYFLIQFLQQMLSPRKSYAGALRNFDIWLKSRLPRTRKFEVLFNTHFSSPWIRNPISSILCLHSLPWSTQNHHDGSHKTSHIDRPQARFFLSLAKSVSRYCVTSFQKDIPSHLVRNTGDVWFETQSGKIGSLLHVSKQIYRDFFC
jgi:hypothetical protein